jgi:hypothetical protein
MVTEITLTAVLVWLVWGFVMGAGWTIAAWVVGKLLQRI